MVTCTVAEPKVSSQTEKIGDPILCELGHTEVYGRTSFPFGSYLIGHFAEYKDPGHFVGKGWMELDFDKLVIQPDTVVPLNARVVATPGYKVDEDGKIHGKGHATKDTVEWLIPVLWPLDLINLPRRGPRPVLKAESKLTLKVLDDFGIPTPQENDVRTPALASRRTADEPTYQQYQPAPVQRTYQQPPQYQQPQYQQPQYQQPQQPVVQNFYMNQGQPRYQAPVQYQQPQVQYVQPAPQVIVQQAPPVVVQAPPRVVYRYPPPPPPSYGYGYYPAY